MKNQRTIVITGFMGSGKTAVARKLATRLDLCAVDLDETITNREGRSPAKIIAEDGEQAFRTIETSTLRDLLNNPQTRIIALGGGAWIQEINRDIINHTGGLTIWLDTDFNVCWERIETSGEDRPFGRNREQAQELYNRRRPIYQLADILVEAPPEESIDELTARIESQIAQVS
jgi:shikimate kinase